MTFVPIKLLESNVCSFLNSFTTNKSFTLFESIFIFRLASLVSKSFFVTKFSRANLASKTSFVS